MSLYFRPISKEDRKAMIKGSFANVNHSPLGNLSDVTVSNNNTVTSTAIFGQTPAHAEDREFSYDDEFTRTGYIDLNECAKTEKTFEQEFREFLATKTSLNAENIEQTIL